ncbi:MAG: DUF1611 domain-containing protein [Deltaproteobacteria bacterium]|nr:DUF1611 domain-containing protein [Deltaproteobacteria bacterium]
MKAIKNTALIYCEKEFGNFDGKTAAGLVRHSELYDIKGVIDSHLAGKDTGEILGEVANGIPVFSTLNDALLRLPEIPDYYIYGKAPLETFICLKERNLILDAMKRGMHLVSGLHQFFSDDPEFKRIAAKFGVQIKDVRKPPKLEDLRIFTGKIANVTVPIVAVLGTDCASGKMTTAIELNKALNAQGVRSVMIATGQTSLMQGAKYGSSIDALTSQFVIGELEHAVLQSVEHDRPDIILIEGQSSVSHPAFMSSIGILKGCMPNSVILQHPPARQFRCDFPHLPMPELAHEIALIETISPAKVIAITLNHENLTDQEVGDFIEQYEKQHGLPTTDVLSYGCQKLIETLYDRFPELQEHNRMKLIRISA